MNLPISPLASIAVLAVPLSFLAGCSCNDYDLTPFQGYDVLDSDHGQWLSMDISPDNRLAVAYHDRTYGGLGFALGEPQADGTVGWLHERVDGYPDDNGLNPGTAGEFCSLTFDGSGTAWVSYFSRSNGVLKVAKRVRKQWTTEIIDTGSGLKPMAGLWTSIAINSDGLPVVAYQDGSAGTLKLATMGEDSTWSTETIREGTDWSGTDEAGEPIERAANVGQFARLLIDGNTHYIAYYDQANQNLQLLEGPPGSYVHSVVHADINVGAWPSISLGEEQLAIAYQDIHNQNLILATRSGGGGFSTTILDEAEYVGADTEIFVKNGNFNIVYFDGRTNDMKLAENDGSAWTSSTIGGDSAAVGFHNEVVQDLDGKWWAASYNFTDRNIYARWVGE